jgi:hypothetical protein
MTDIHTFTGTPRQKHERKAQCVLLIMSDLAPFVAAAVSDKVVADLQDENRKLKDVNQEREECNFVSRAPMGLLSTPWQTCHTTCLTKIS